MIEKSIIMNNYQKQFIKFVSMITHCKNEMLYLTMHEQYKKRLEYIRSQKRLSYFYRAIGMTEMANHHWRLHMNTAAFTHEMYGLTICNN